MDKRIVLATLAVLGAPGVLQRRRVGDDQASALVAGEDGLEDVGVSVPIVEQRREQRGIR